MSDQPEAVMSEAELAAAAEKRARMIDAAANMREARIRKRAARLAQERMAVGPRPAVIPVTAGRAERTREPSLPESELPTRRGRDERVGGMDILPHEAKPGWDYQWISVRVLGQSVDRSRISDFKDNGGWRVVTGRDMPSRADPTMLADAPIEQEGCILMTRPMGLTLEARQEDTDTAYRQQHDRMRAAANGESAVRGEQGIPHRRGLRTVPVEISIVGEAG